MKYSDDFVCRNCDMKMRGKGVEKDSAGTEYIACEYCSARYSVVRHQPNPPAGRIYAMAGELLMVPSPPSEPQTGKSA